MLGVLLYGGVIEPPTDEPLGIEDSVAWIPGDLVLGCITNESLSLGESNVGRSGPVALVIGNDVHSLVLPDTHTRVGGT